QGCRERAYRGAFDRLGDQGLQFETGEGPAHRGRKSPARGRRHLFVDPARLKRPNAQAFAERGRRQGHIVGVSSRACLSNAFKLSIDISPPWRAVSSNFEATFVRMRTS